MALNYFFFGGLIEVSSREYTLSIYVRGGIGSSKEEKNEMSEVNWSNTTK